MSPRPPSLQVYRILIRHSACVQPLSCDEAYLDVTGLGDPEQLAAQIRAEIAATTQCTASAGQQFRCSDFSAGGCNHHSMQCTASLGQ